MLELTWCGGYHLLFDRSLQLLLALRLLRVDGRDALLELLLFGALQLHALLLALLVPLRYHLLTVRAASKQTQQDHKGAIIRFASAPCAPSRAPCAAATPPSRCATSKQTQQDHKGAISRFAQNCSLCVASAVTALKRLLAACNHCKIHRCIDKAKF